MPMSSGGHAASSNACATRPKAQEIGSTGYAAPTQHSSHIGSYVMATAEHREPCDSRGSCTVVCPAKAGVFSRSQSYRGKSQTPRSLDGRVAGNQDSEAHRQSLPRGDCESPGRNESERASGLESE